MKFIKNFLLGILVFFCYFILFYSPGNTQDDLNIKEAEIPKIIREARILLQGEPIKTDNILPIDQTENVDNVDVESVNVRYFPIRLRDPNNSHSDDSYDFYKPQGIILEYRHKF